MTFIHRFSQWPAYFFVKEFAFQKCLGEDGMLPNQVPRVLDCTALLNEEVVLLRALLSEELGVSDYAFVYEGYPRDGGGGHLSSLPWRPRLGVSEKPSTAAVANYARNRALFKKMRHKPGWAAVMASMRRFALAWENPFPADSLADIIAALESLLVREKSEVSYKLRVRAANLLTSDRDARRRIHEDIRLGYDYRSRVAHGEFVFDNPREWETAKALGRAKGKQGNPFHDVNEVRRLRATLAGHYRAALTKLIASEELETDWVNRGL